MSARSSRQTTSLRNIQKSRAAAIRKVEQDNVKREEEADSPEARARAERIRKNAEKIAAKKPIVLNFDEKAALPSNIRLLLENTLKYFDMNQRKSYYIDERLLEQMGRIYLGTLLVTDGFFSEDESFVASFLKAEIELDEWFRDHKDELRAQKLNSAYQDLKYRIETFYNNMSEEFLERLRNEEKDFLEKHKFSQLSPEERAAILAQQQALAEEQKHLETEQLLLRQQEALRRMEEEREARRQAELAREKARKQKELREEEKRNQTMAEYLNNPDTFWSTPDEPSRSRRRTTRSKK